jgi:hypothetical protein
VIKAWKKKCCEVSRVVTKKTREQRIISQRFFFAKITKLPITWEEVLENQWFLKNEKISLRYLSTAIDE